MTEDIFKVSWHALEPEEVLEDLDVPPETGLSSAEVAERLETYGHNELVEKPGRTIWQKLWEQINSFVIWLLIGAAVVSAILGDWVEAGAIMLIVILNAIMGIVQESRAEASLAALKKMAAPEAQVLRDGHRQSVPRVTSFLGTSSSSKRATSSRGCAPAGSSQPQHRRSLPHRGIRAS